MHNELTIVTFKDNESEHGSMSNDLAEKESPLSPLKSEEARQRWDMFHRAIAHAKQSNHAALMDEEAPVSKPKRLAPVLSIAR